MNALELFLGVTMAMAIMAWWELNSIKSELRRIADRLDWREQKERFEALRGTQR
jgi:hypothetical protein